MTPLRNQLPWAVRNSGFYLPVGTILEPQDAMRLFGQHYSPDATYMACIGGYVRRVVSQEEGLPFFVTAQPCRHGHFDARIVRRRKNGRTSHECATCRAIAKRGMGK